MRHLLMPGHFDCCTAPILSWLAQYPRIEVSLLTQYLAPAHAKGELAETLREDEIGQAKALAEVPTPTPIHWLKKIHKFLSKQYLFIPIGKMHWNAWNTGRKKVAN
ncbi:MAG: hypothetical protein AAF518_12365 [Spirochaetota bacterium]